MNLKTYMLLGNLNKTIINPMVGGCLLSAVAISANAAPVTVTADFTLFTLGRVMNNGESLYVNEIFQLNNANTVALSGNSVTFSKGNVNKYNAFSFAGNRAEVGGTGLANVFTLGRFTYTNGNFYAEPTYIDFKLTTHSTDATLDNHIFDGRINLTVTPSLGGTPEAEADFFTVQDAAGNTISSLGSVRVYDYNICPAGNPTAPNCNVGSVDVIGHINSLHLDSFANATGGAFINSSTTPPLNPVPVPSAVYLFGSGLIGLLGMRKKKLNFAA